MHEKEELETMTIQELERLIALYGRDIFSFCVHLTGSMQEAEELYQDAFLMAVERMADIREDGNPPPPSRRPISAWRWASPVRT